MVHSRSVQLALKSEKTRSGGEFEIITSSNTKSNVMKGVRRFQAGIPNEIVIERWRENNSVKEWKLHVFCEPALRLETVASMRQKLRTLIVVGQPEVTSVKAIAELKHLEELWIVECSLKDVTALRTSKKLQKLYLYANKIREIPDLSNCKRLTILSLARNKISDLTNLRGMPHLQDINLADNEIGKIDDIFSETFELLHVNLSGNPLRRLDDVRNLSVLSKLQSIEFGDPLYGECPLVSLCNYRSWLIRRLPSLREIDYYPVGLEERFDSTNNELPFYMWSRYFINGLLNKRIFTKIFGSDEVLQIKHLTINNCSIVEVNFQDICLPHLESLDLSKNRISSLQGWSSLKKLHTLCVSHNQLGILNEEKKSWIHSDVQICPDITVLYADHNKICSIEDICFPKMPSLKYIFLQHNKMRNVNGMQDFPSLETAVLDHNRIEDISEESFRSNRNLKTLLLENNRLTSLAFTKYLSNIERLFVANNKIVNKNDLKKNLKELYELRQLTIFGNPLCKSCNQYTEIIEIIEWIKAIDGHCID